MSEFMRPPKSKPHFPEKASSNDHGLNPLTHDCSAMGHQPKGIVTALGMLLLEEGDPSLREGAPMDKGGLHYGTNFQFYIRSTFTTYKGREGS